MSTPRRAYIWAYSLLLLPVSLLVAVIITAATGGKFPGGLGSAISIACAALCMGGVFLLRHRRHFTTPEYRWLMAYCLGWKLIQNLVLCRFFYYDMKQTMGQSFANYLGRVLPVSMVIDAVFILIGFEAMKLLMCVLLDRMDRASPMDATTGSTVAQEHETPREKE